MPHTHDIEDLDIVVVGSDGLFDNVDKEMIQRMLQEHIDDSKKIKDIKTLCLELGNLSYKLSLDKYVFSIFYSKVIIDIINTNKKKF